MGGKTIQPSCEPATGTALASSAFHDRLTPQLAELLRKLTFRALAVLSQQTRRMQLALCTFVEVVVADDSLVRPGDAVEWKIERRARPNFDGLERLGQTVKLAIDRVVVAPRTQTKKNGEQLRIALQASADAFEELDV